MLERIKGIYDRLPSWMQPGIKKRNTEEIQFRNGSRIRSFASTGGRSFTANLAVVDEADHLQQSQNLETLLDAVEPTVNDGGRLVLISTSNKDKPESHFKAIYRNAVEGKNAYTPLFLPWGARPTRDQDWYEEQKRDKFNNTGSLDSLYQEYPETVEQALAPRSLNKRIPFNWLQQCYVSMDAIEIPAPHFPKPPSIPKLKIYQLPFMRKKYCISGDPAEGNPTSDESSCHVIDVETGEECANLIGLFEPETFADYIADIAIWFNHASAMIERNNHGHAVLVVLRRRKIKIMQGHDGKPGWLSSPKGKAMLYARAASCFQHGEVTIHDFGTLTQLQSIEGNTLRAPEGQFDDRADSFAMACCGMIAMAGQTPAKPFVHG